MCVNLSQCYLTARFNWIFGYDGYCLPNDTKQLRANYADVSNCISDELSDVARKVYTRDMFGADD